MSTGAVAVGITKGARAAARDVTRHRDVMGKQEEHGVWGGRVGGEELQRRGGEAGMRDRAQRRQTTPSLAAANVTVTAPS